MSENLLSLHRVKQHLRIDHDYEDELLAGYREAALDHAQMYLGVRLVEDTASIAQSGDFVVNSAIQAACLLLIAHFYANREGGNMGRTDEMPQGYYALLMPYRSYIGVAGW